ncbi:hypothetical protein BGX38DRAFT_1221878 [Terfezia claveryi]|nr:hypothetical protein BGX38DRAFT_1221878 [Terfezia claveryi]
MHILFLSLFFCFTLRFSLILLFGVIWLVKAFKYCHLVYWKLITYFNLLIFALYSHKSRGNWIRIPLE